MSTTTMTLITIFSNFMQDDRKNSMKNMKRKNNRIDRMEKYERSLKKLPAFEDSHSSRLFAPVSFNRKVSLNGSKHSKSGREYEEDDSLNHKRIISKHLDKIENLDYSFMQD